MTHSYNSWEVLPGIADGDGMDTIGLSCNEYHFTNHMNKNFTHY